MAKARKAATKKAATKKVQFIKSPIAEYKLAYHIGESAEFPIEKADELINKKFAVEI